MTIEEMIKYAMARMIERDLNIENVKVLSWDEDFERGSFDGCETCGYGADDDTYKVYISYEYPGLKWPTAYTHTGSFAELIKELDAK